MAELSALRARLRDRQVKEGALGTTEVSICLDMSLLGELEELERERAEVGTGGTSNMLAGPSSSTAKLDAAVKAKEDEIRAASILVVFRAVSSTRYQEIVNEFEDPDGTDQIAWLDALAAACYAECWSEGERADVPWSEVKEATAFGELNEIRTKVFDMNRRKQDLPFSSRPSRTTRSNGVKPKPA